MKPPPAPAPVSQLETIEVLVANSDIGAGHALTDQDIKWQIWPVAAAGPTFISKNERPDAIADVKGSITRAPFIDRRADPGRPADQGQRLRLSGGDPAVRHARDLGRNARRKPAPAASCCRATMST